MNSIVQEHLHESGGTRPPVIPRQPKTGIGTGHPVYIIAEIGINHNGSLALAKRLIDEAVLAGCDAVKFQKRTPELMHAEGSVAAGKGYALGSDDVYQLPAHGRAGV